MIGSGSVDHSGSSNKERRSDNTGRNKMGSFKVPFRAGSVLTFFLRGSSSNSSMTMPSSVVTCDQKVDVEPPSLRGGEGVELLQEQASLLGLGDK